MGFLFRRSIRILPGLHLNLGKRGASISVSGRGAHVTVGHGQVRETVGLPGTGLGYPHVEGPRHAAGKPPSEAQPPAASEVSPPGKAWRGWVWILLLIALAVAVTLSACGENDQEAEAKDLIADSNQSPVTSCAWDSMEGQRLNRLSHIDEADVCNMLQSALGRSPSVALARKVSKLVFIMQVGGSPDTAKEITY
jgi:Protein of unknown function (DUF4236)